MMQEHARQDVVGWLTRQQAADAGGATAAAMSLLEGVAHKLNCSLNLGLVAPHQCMCACYDGGGANGEIDCTNSREVTVILYTSENWREEHGGCLRVYQSAPDAPSVNCEDYTDIEPMAGRLVIFKSQKVLHEVRPSFAKRIALSMWMLRTSSSPPIIVD
jgi:SM-20-related protein